MKNQVVMSKTNGQLAIAVPLFKLIEDEILEKVDGYVINIGDILYNPFLDQVSEVVGFNTDKIGQRAICFRIRKKKYSCATAWVVFRYFEPLGVL